MTQAQPPIWRLRANHYLNVPNTFFIQRTTDGETGEQIEHRYPVPRLIEIDDAKYHNAGAGITLVSTDPAAKLVNGRMIIFTGPPTPDMEPQNEAAEAISETFRSVWAKPFEELSATGGGVNFAKDLETALARVLDAASASKSTSLAEVKPDILAELQKQMQQLMNKNAELEAAVAALPKAEASTVGRRA